MSDLPPGAEPTGPRAGGGPVSVLARIFVKPGEAFRALSRRPTWVAALVVVMGAALATQLVVVPRIDFETTVRQAVEQRGGDTRLNEQELDRQVETVRKIARFTMFLSPLVVALIFLLLAGVYFLGLRAAGSEAEYRSIFSTVVHAALPASVVSAALGIVVALQRATVTGEEARHLLKSNLGAWLPASTPATVQAAASVLDVFNAWQWILLVLGFEIVARVRRGRAIAVVAVVWVGWALLKVGGAALRSAF